MSAHDDAGETQSLSSAAAQIDRVCDRFEADWRAGKQPRIEDALLQGPHFARNNLFRELLEIELQVRQQGGETPAAEQYHGRFPEFAEVIDTVFCRATGPKRLGDYELLEELGKGGMGVVYRARHVLLNQTVALKVLPERFLNEPQAVSRFRREMQSIGGLDHPNIVRAHNAGEAERQHFLVMEYVDGVNLQQLVAGRGPLPIGAACEMIRQAALGLQHAHEHGLVHRDIKPANLMLNRRGTVKILDLGLARLHASQLSQGLTQEGIPMGTVDYMAPEQWEDSSKVDIRADIYSLGCTLFHLVAGQAPYADTTFDTNRKKLMAHTVAPIPALAQRRDDAPEELDDVLALMMAKEPQERFGSPAEVAEALDPFAEPAEVDALVAAALARPAGTAVSDAGIKNSNVDTAKRLRRDSGVSKKPSSRLLRGKPQPWHRRVPRAAWAGTAATLVLLLLAWTLWPTPAPPERKHLQTEVALLPSLNGGNNGWWAEELPWLMPFVRKAIVEAMEKNRTYRQMTAGAADPRRLLTDPDVPAVHRRLREWTEQVRSAPRAFSPRQAELLDALLAMADGNSSDDELGAQLRAAVEAFSAGRDADEPWTAEDLHALAVLEHRLAALGPGNGSSEKGKNAHRKDWGKLARQHYDEAYEKYERAAGKEPPLWRLCLADAALLHAQYLGGREDAKPRYLEQARGRFERAVAGLSDGEAAFFRADVLINKGMAAHDAAEYEDVGHAMKTARDLLDDFAKQDPGNRYHPLLAHVAERHAWLLADRWKVEEAKQRFEAAQQIREENLRTGNEAARINIFHDRHGRAIVLRYQGDAAAAKAEFKGLLAEDGNSIPAAIKDARRRGLPQRYLRDLQERLYNSSERYADCFLYGGVASDRDDETSLTEAIKYYQQAHDNADERLRAAMNYKWAVVLALGGKSNEAAEQRIKAAGARIAVADAISRKDLGAEAERTSLLQHVAKAVVALRSAADPKTGQQALGAFLAKCRDREIVADWKRREPLELQLFCAELLIDSALKAKETQAAREHVQSHLKPLTGALVEMQLTKFAWRYCDFAVRALDAQDADAVLFYVREARGRPAIERGTTLLAFHFSDSRGVAVVRVPETENAGTAKTAGPKTVVVPIDCGRNDVLTGTKFDPPQQLVDAVAARPAGGPIQWLWEEKDCFPDSGRALQDKDWPFGDGLGVRPDVPAEDDSGN